MRFAFERNMIIVELDLNTSTLNGLETEVAQRVWYEKSLRI
jgi:hypothetical protein